MEQDRQNEDRPCEHCGATTWEAVVEAAVWTEGGLVAVEGIPARVCQGCGEQFFDEQVSRTITGAARNPAVAPKRQILVPLFSLTDVELPKSQARPEGLDEEEIEAAELTFAGEEQTGQEPREDRESGEAYVCKYCGSDTCDELVKSAFWADRGLVAVEDVPARVCRQCGERFYDERTTWKIEKVIGDPTLQPKQTLTVPLWSLAEIEALGRRSDTPEVVDE